MYSNILKLEIALLKKHFRKKKIHHWFYKTVVVIL